MKSLVVVSHPDSRSLTQYIARSTVEALRGAGGSADLVDLTAEKFDPSFSEADVQFYRGAGPVPDDVEAEQKRLDEADQLILVFPVYWWSMPAQLKGWIDRVFVNGWAFDYTPGKSFEKKLSRLQVHLVPVAGDDADSFERHGLDVAFRNQIESGIFEYCGAVVGSTTFVHESDTKPRDILAGEIQALAAGIAARTSEPCLVD
ncbi:NAD(P)H-dependent oxidoreductase [Rhodococcus sp. G-MC3]|uniref:NAD(P)H-dependent oxidoreductase n=1 Tax=Rhodococcus sp. G-MC3 TaxID=3046209 RepID=UPI0024BB3A34|nr:NAD(P)H-dependent oxidoreductase [Rhodococcus sp. G-MC3]MDJ0393640.1 NAD(P)H-dependent oxidoreductase [Rhodococcus sp. G-MC3]